MLHTPETKKKKAQQNKRKRKQSELEPRPPRAQSSSSRSKRYKLCPKRRRVTIVSTSASDFVNPYLNVPFLESQPISLFTHQITIG